MKISVEKSKRITTGILLASGATMFAGKVLECDFQDKPNFENETVKVQPFRYSTGKVIPQKGFWIVEQGPGARPGHIGGAIITPKSVASSWGAMYKDGKLNGAFSFFMSDSNGLNPKTPHNSIRPLDLDNRQKKGLRLVILNINNSIGCEMLSLKDGFIYPNGKKLNHFVFSGKAAMSPNAPCHIAVTFSTAADGMTTGKLYCKPGTDAIVPDKDKPQATIKFKLDPSVVKTGFFPGTFRYGKMTNIGKAPMEQRFARLTLYDSIPQELPGFDVKFATGKVEKKKVTEATEPTRHPAVAFIGSTGGRLGFHLARILDKDGFTVNDLPRNTLHGHPLRWNQIKNYNVLVISGLGESNADKSLTSFNKETAVVLRKYLDAGGGILMLGHFGQRQTEITPQEVFLKPLGLQPVWMEMPVNKKSVVATPWQVDFGYTTDIKDSPITKGVKALWYPAPKTRIGDQHHSLTFTTDKNWKTVITGGKDSSTTYNVKGSHTSVAGEKHKPTWEKDMPLVALRTVGPGRIVYLGITHEYIQGRYAHSVLEDIVLNKGIGYRRSDGLKLLENSLRWLAGPSDKSRKLGGASTNKNLLLDPEKVVYGKPFNWNVKHDFRQTREDMPGLIGARTAYSSGKGTVEQWVKAAKKLGLKFIVFLEEYSKLKPEDFDKLKAECLKFSNANFAAFPGFTIDDEIGNHYYYFGNAIPLPGPNLIDVKKKVFISYDPALGGHVKGQLGMTSLRFATGMCISKMTSGNYLFTKDAAPFSNWFGNWNSMAVMTSFDGKIEEFVFDDYRKIVNAGQGPTPLALTFVDDPAKIREAKWHTVYKSTDGNIANLKTFFNRHKFYPQNPCANYISSGPRIDSWNFVGPRDYEGSSRGDYLWNNYRWIIRGTVSSDVPLKEVRVWDGVKLFRCFLPKGKKKFTFDLDLTHNQQHYPLLEVIDEKGGIAISREHWDRNHRLEEFNCGDRNNQLSYSKMINSKGYQVMVGNNRTLGTPYKRIWDLALSGQPHEVFRTVAGFDGGRSYGPKFYANPRFIAKDGTKTSLPYITESRRRLHSFDVAIGDGIFKYDFTDNIRVANVWHTVWKTKPNEYFDVYYRMHYFQLDPDRPIGALLKCHKITLKKNLPNNGIALGNFMRPRDSKQYALRGAKGGFWAGAFTVSKTPQSVDVDFGLNSYAAMFDSSNGGAAVYPMLDGLKGHLRMDRINSFFSMNLPTELSPQKAGESVEFKMLYVGTPARPPHPLKNNRFFEKFYRQLGLDGGKGGYKLDIRSGSVLGQRYILRADGSRDKCFSAKISGKLVARLPIAVSNMNEKWSAYLYDGGMNKLRPLGILENTVWATIVVSGQELFAGHPVTADDDRLFIQVTQVGTNAWNIEIHNPTDKDLIANVKLNKYFPPFKGKQDIGRISLKAGSSIYKSIK